MIGIDNSAGSVLMRHGGCLIGVAAATTPWLGAARGSGRRQPQQPKHQTKFGGSAPPAAVVAANRSSQNTKRNSAGQSAAARDAHRASRARALRQTDMVKNASMAVV